MKLKSFGCSFVWGTDLSDFDTKTGSCLTWPALLAQKLNLEYQCHAQGGMGNLGILERLLNHLDSPGDLYIISWTWLDRFDYSTYSGTHFDGQFGDWSALLPSDTSSVSRTYYKNLHSEYRDKLTGLIYVQTAIDILRSKGHSFVMTYMDSLLLCRKWHTTPAITTLQDYVTPHLSDFEGLNFLEWSKRHDYPIGPGLHPLEKAHSAATDLMLPRAIEALAKS